MGVITNVEVNIGYKVDELSRSESNEFVIKAYNAIDDSDFIEITMPTINIQQTINGVFSCVRPGDEGGCGALKAVINALNGPFSYEQNEIDEYILECLVYMRPLFSQNGMLRKLFEISGLDDSLLDDLSNAPAALKR
jgi:hypothetical protein